MANPAIIDEFLAKWRKRDRAMGRPLVLVTQAARHFVDGQAPRPRYGLLQSRSAKRMANSTSALNRQGLRKKMSGGTFP